MSRNFLRPIFQALVLTITLVSCRGAPATVPAETGTPVTPTVSAIPDPCAPGQIEAAVQKINRHMREFDDASLLASKVPRQQLGEAVTNWQKIRREADDESAPDCLANLKKYQLDHMNSVINTLLAFMNGADQQTIDQGINLARQQHDQYTLELARLLGLTAVPATP